MRADTGMVSVQVCHVVTVKFNLALVKIVTKVKLNINKFLLQKKIFTHLVKIHHL